MYKLSVKTLEENPNFEEEMSEYKNKSRSNYFNPNGAISMPEKYREVKALEVELTDSQFDAIRKAVIEKF